MESKIKTNRIKLKQTHRYREQTGGHQKEAGLGAKWVKGVNCMMITRLIMVITLCSIQRANYYVVHLKLMFMPIVMNT